MVDGCWIRLQVVVTNGEACFDNLAQVLLGIGLFLLAFSLTFITATLCHSPLFSKTSLIAYGYLATLLLIIAVGSYLCRPRDEFTQPIEVIVLGAIPYLMTALLLDGGRVLRATNYALIPYLMVACIIYLRWKQRNSLDVFVLKWGWLASIVILAPIFYRAFEGKRLW